MSSKSILSKREELIKTEARIRHELESVSDLFETKTKNILIISAIGGGILLGAYGIYAYLSGSDTSKVKKVKKKSKSRKSSFNLQNLLAEKAASAALNYLNQEFKNAMSKNRKDKKG